MMRIYSQYTIGGFKIFNFTAFPHTDGNTKYVLMKEIGEAKESAHQEILLLAIVLVVLTDESCIFLQQSSKCLDSSRMWRKQGRD